MAVMDNQVLDLSDQEVLDYFGRERRQVGDSKRFEASIVRQITDLGMHVASQRPEPGDFPEDTTLITAVRRYYEVIANGQIIQTISLTMRVIQSFGVHADTNLAVRGAAHEAAIVQLFRDYNSARDGDIEAYATAKAQQLGASPDEFALYFAPTLTLKAWDMDRQKEDALRNYFAGFREKGFELRPIRDEFIPTYQPTRPGGVIEVPAGTGPGEIERKVEEAAKEEARQNECHAERYEKIKIASLNRWPDTKVEWRWALVNWGKWKFHFWRPVTLIRDVELVLYVTITYLNADERLKSIFLDCLKEAAVDAAVTGVVTENFDAAVAAFKAVFWKLLKQKIRETVNCLIPGLRLVEEAGNWRVL
ncbi:hypothetical protein SAMN05216573_12250 [Bradyrhizobium sp. Rc3b]|uniref:hypothetical protein n=1 Tax=Bradyrhizobium sp. Rc3b TaxID=1855322 RepID=UPI0008E0F698|nr:hypothetical protein [Bradyrhizobium sp. Rc3b]SFN80702.1 hypothetical protein SAMN05216573_12250 [Bradyrhizobium sp. Rc3b]